MNNFSAGIAAVSILFGAVSNASAGLSKYQEEVLVSSGKFSSAVIADLDQNDQARVIVIQSSADQDIDRDRAQIIEGSAGFVTDVWPIDNRPYFTATIDVASAMSFSSDSLVSNATADPILTLFMQESIPQVGLDVVRDTLSLGGTGVGVAVIDTGIAKRIDGKGNIHDLLGLVPAEEKCFCEFEDEFGNIVPCCPNNTREDTDATNLFNAHGTHVANIVAGNGSQSGVDQGGTPDVELVMIKTSDETSGNITFSNVIRALAWIADESSATDIDIVNLSLGYSLERLPDFCSFQHGDGNLDPVFYLAELEIDRLYAQGVVVVAAAGNERDKTQVAKPFACLPETITVSAVYDSNAVVTPDCSADDGAVDTIPCFSNRGRPTDVLAPGADITSLWHDDAAFTTLGTSQSAPHVTACAAQLFQAANLYEITPTPETIRAALTASPVVVEDPVNPPFNYQYYPRLDCVHALDTFLADNAADVEAQAETVEGGLRATLFNNGGLDATNVQYRLYLSSASVHTATSTGTALSDCVGVTPPPHTGQMSLWECESDIDAGESVFVEWALGGLAPITVTIIIDGADQPDSNPNNDTDSASYSGSGGSGS